MRVRVPPSLPDWTNNMSVIVNTGLSDSLVALQNEVAPLKVFKKSELEELFGKYHKWSDNKSNCGQKKRKEGKEAFDLIVRHNLKLVIKIAHQYKYAGMEPEDLINEGSIGLMEAVERFDVNNGAKFSTYASLWIKQRIRRCLSNKSRTIRIPVHVAEKVGKVADYINEYRIENNNKLPSIDQIKKNVKGISKQILNDLVNGGVINISSLDFKLVTGEDDSKTFGDVIEDEKIIAPDIGGEFSDNVNNLTIFLNKLKGREKMIIKRRFGLGNKPPETLEEIAESYNVSRERIRQLQVSAMRRLRTLMGKQYQENFFIPK